jgi:hypothetical protein
MFSSTGPGGLQTPSTEPVRTPKITRGHSCVLCFQRKVKCDGQRPCSTCIKARIECITKAPTLPRRRRAEISKGDLLARLRRCEGLLKSHGVKVEDEIDDQKTMGQQMAHSPGDSRSPKSTADIGKLIIERGHSRYIENDLWSELGDEVRFSSPVALKIVVIQSFSVVSSSCRSCSVHHCAPSVLAGVINGFAYQACIEAPI